MSGDGTLEELLSSDGKGTICLVVDLAMRMLAAAFSIAQSCS